jgi:hypothetical protein
LLIALDYVSHHHELDRDQKKHLKLKALSGNELVDSVARLCVMNLYLHGVGGNDCPIDGGVDNLQSDDKCLPLLALQRHHSKRNSASASDRDTFPSSSLMSCTYRRRPRKELKEVGWTKPTRVGEGITQRRAGLRLCNLVAPGHARCLRRSLSRKSKKGTDSAGG